MRGYFELAVLISNSLDVGSKILKFCLHHTFFGIEVLATSEQQLHSSLMVPDSAVLTFYACISFFFPLAGTHDRYRTLTTKMIWPQSFHCSAKTYMATHK